MKVSDRVSKLDVSGIRRVFDLAQDLKNPINLSIGQPDFDVPDNIKHAAMSAIENNVNSYTPTQGQAALIDSIKEDSHRRGLHFEDAIVTSGVSGGLFLAFSSILNPGDEVLCPDPYFLMYKQLASFLDAKVTYIPTYPDFKCTAERIEPFINDKSKLLLLNAPGNPTGVGLSDSELKDIVLLLEKFPNITVISDEIYRLFYYHETYTSIASLKERVVTLDGFSKSHGLTGWRVGWALGPRDIIQQMAKLQQFTFVCSPAPAQKACLEALGTNMSHYRDQYSKKRDFIYELLESKFEVTKPDGTFYIFPKVPEKYSSSQEFVEAALKKNLLIIPGNVFSEQDSHFRISFATSEENLKLGADALNALV